MLVETGAPALRLLAGRGNGTFGPQRPIDTGAPMRHAALADLDGDGKLDLAAGTNTDLRLLYGSGDGTFDPPQILDLGAPVANAAAADLDGDGKIDIVLAHERREESTVLRNEGRRAFRPTARVAATGVLAIRDVDGDGILTGAESGAELVTQRNERSEKSVEQVGTRREYLVTRHE